MIQSITFGDKNTWDDWKILPTERPVFAPPKPKTTYIDIPGGNGALDLSESLTGYPIYENRTGSFKFRVMNDYVEWHERYTEIMEHLHGRSMNAILADDPDYFYRGRFTVNNWESGATWSLITIGYTVDPYKWSNLLSTQNNAFSNIVINNTSAWTIKTFDGKLFGTAPISPTFIVSNSSGLTVRYVNTYLGVDETVYLIDGENEIPNFVFYGQSLYTFMFKGIGTVSIKFRVGRL